MTGNRSYLSELNERILGKVRFGDDSCMSICEKGFIVFEGKTGEQRLLTNVYYILNLKSNIVSLGLATETGCEVNMKDDDFLLLDNMGIILMKV
jgi:hypothetical protein